MLSGTLEPLFNATEMVDRIEIVDPEPIVRVTLFMRDHEIEFSDRLLARPRTTNKSIAGSGAGCPHQ